MGEFVVDLVIPAYNEAANVGALFDALEDIVGEERAVRRVILVDNRSTDGTGELAAARGATVVREERAGYGAACLAGIAAAVSGEVGPPMAIAFLDADLSDDPAELPRLIEPVLAGEADLALGQRGRLAERGALEPHQRFGNALACFLMWAATGRRYRDLGPMRVVTVAALERLEMADMTWGWTVEMQHKAATRGLMVVEIDVPYRNRHAGESKISGSVVGSYRAGVKIISTIGRLWWGERGDRRGALRASG
ncbi:MAG: glycosyltransferase family 2 protein [Planctomycetota bacterium]